MRSGGDDAIDSGPPRRGTGTGKVDKVDDMGEGGAGGSTFRIPLSIRLVPTATANTQVTQPVQ
jgi:hypothetical protein